MSPNLGHSWAPVAPPWPVSPPGRTSGDILPFAAASCSPSDAVSAAVGLAVSPPASTCVLTLLVYLQIAASLDVVLLLDGSSSIPASYFDEMKSFTKAFISRANIGE